MDPPPTLPDFREHLAAIISSDTPIDLDDRLVDTFAAQLTDTNTPPLISELIPTIQAAIPRLQCDPTPIAALLIKLLSTLSFTEILQFIGAETFANTLSFPHPSIQNLGLSLLGKAAATPAEAGILASWLDVTRQLLTLSLAAQDTGVAMNAMDVLVALLTTDAVDHNGAGVLWRRVFGDESVYRLLFEWTSWKGVDLGSRRQKTEAQGRLLSLLSALAVLDWESLCRPRSGRLEEGEFYTRDPEKDAGFGGVMLYAATKMVEAKEDVMMHMLLLDFYSDLLGSAGKRAWGFLAALGIVQHCITLAVAPEQYTDDFLEHGLLQGRASTFVARISELFPEELNLPPSEPLGEQIIALIKKHLRQPYQGPHSPSLGILRVLPDEWVVGKDILPLIPLSPPEPEFLSTLGTLIQRQPLYREYLASKPEMWEKVVSYASAPALAESALAALGVIDAVSAASGGWGVDEVERAPGVMGLLVEVPQRFLGREVESMAWRVWRRKVEVAGGVMRRLPPGNPWRDRLKERIEGGVGARDGRAVEIATVEL